MSPNVVDGLIYLTLMGLLLLTVHIAAVVIDKRNKQKVEMARTPVSEEGLKTYDELPADIAVALAWSDPGNNPTWHFRMQQIVRAQMPVLARALDRMVETNNKSLEGEN
jgi:hypothetical protein